MRELRYANIGLVVAFVVLAIGVYLVKDSGEGAIQAVGALAFVVAHVVHHALEGRARRRGHLQ